MYVYILSEKWTESGITHKLYTVGFYKPDGRFEPESDHSNKKDAANRVNFLNGGNAKSIYRGIANYADGSQEQYESFTGKDD